MIKSISKKVGVTLAIGSFIVPAMISSVSSADSEIYNDSVQPRTVLLSQVFSGKTPSPSAVRNTVAGKQHLFDVFNTRDGFTIYLRRAPGNTTTGTVMYSAKQAGKTYFTPSNSEPVRMTANGTTTNSVVSGRLTY